MLKLKLSSHISHKRRPRISRYSIFGYFSVEVQGTSINAILLCRRGGV